MRVLVMGAGGVGGYYGGVLTRHGHDVTLVARGAHLAALRERGLELRPFDGEPAVLPVKAVGSPDEADAGFDLVLFTVKGYDTETAAPLLRPVVGERTAVLTMQNGVDHVDYLSATFGAERVLAGTTMVAATIAEPGVIVQSTPFTTVVLGELSGEVTPRVEAIAAALRDAGVEVTVSRDARVAVWNKFAMLAPHASLTSACATPVGPIRATPEGAALYRALIAETVAVGRASGVPLADAGERAWAFIQSLPEGAKSSMQRDFERQGRTELEQLTGAVVRRGRDLGVPTPHFDVLYAVLKARAHSFQTG